MGYTVFVIDPHFLARKGYQYIFDGAEEVECVGAAAGLEEALERIAETSPDVVVTEIMFDRQLKVDVVRQLKTLQEDRPVLVVSLVDSDRVVIRAIEAGADGYLIKWEAGEQLISAVHSIRAGEAVLSSSLDRPQIRERF